MADGGKGSGRRPGIIPPGAWERIFTPELCLRCGRTGHTPEDCKMPIQKEDGKDDHSR